MTSAAMRAEIVEAISGNICRCTGYAQIVEAIALAAERMPFPIGDEEPAKIVAAAGLKPDQAASITGGLAEKLFRVG